jgi:uncharacterized membrane protein YciS (DUF1049 family)
LRIFTYIFILFIVILGITFAALNHEPVSFNYYFNQQTLPLSFLLVLAFLFGSLLGLLMGAWMGVKLKLKNYRLQQQLKVALKEIENLRAIPLKDSR